jgi:aminoacyl tRNA synthase complex-interacting multifunctional protein 1
MARRILTQAKPVTTELDKMIYRMETVLGKPHVASPFPELYMKYLADETQEETKVAVKAEPEKPAEIKSEEKN